MTKALNAQDVSLSEIRIAYLIMRSIIVAKIAVM